MQDFIMLLRMARNFKLMNYFWNFHLIFLDGWPCITETKDRETLDKGELLRPQIVTIHVSLAKLQATLLAQGQAGGQSEFIHLTNIF